MPGLYLGVSLQANASTLTEIELEIIFAFLLYQTLGGCGKAMP